LFGVLVGAPLGCL